ncbi:hypothetical protein KP509_04G011000 [Ceratopteris richardii]|uniref:HAUS augmin-like complex subunit 6 N-terminal domain-containing protein n=1 Tax=Ceratopteris richardii TaxID=49495 RepID=A0A8T2UXP3_CERRI|nr:hypothetical protein KP509_04G011000 [Ceratopteris richardii]
MDSVFAVPKEKDKEQEKEKDKEKDKEREREMEMEAALYTNCLLLGLDSSVLGQGGLPRSGLFRHSNPRMGEALLHFLLSALRGPAQSAKDFSGVWPIFDAGQSRDFRKIVQNLINELEAQGALPRSNSRVSSLATCCGQRFVELLWQLSAHALREVHKRCFPADVAANPLPPSLTEIVSQSNNASALLTVTKARIAIERRRFLDGAAVAVRREALWSSLAHDMTAEYRALCAEEAYLQHELEKLQEPRYQRECVIKEGQNGAEIAPERQKPLSISKATQLWESLTSSMAQHEKLASGPIEDLIAHREHRYRVSGPALRAAMDRGSIMRNDLSSLSGFDESHTSTKLKNVHGETNSSSSHAQIDNTTNAFELNDEVCAKIDERSVKGPGSLDVAEILRRWTHSLQRLHKQALRLARANDGTGPDLIREACDDGHTGHSQALHTTLAEHKQHLANIQALIVQLKDSVPNMEGSIASLREQVNRATPLMVSSSTSSPLFDKLVMSMEGCCGQEFDAKGKSGDRSSEAPTAGAHLKTARLFEPPPSNTMMEQALIPKIIKADGEGSKDNNLAFLRQSVHDAALSNSKTSEGLSKAGESGLSAQHFFMPIVALEDEKRKILSSSPEYHRFEETSSFEKMVNDNDNHHKHHLEDIYEAHNRASNPSSKCLSYNSTVRGVNETQNPQTGLGGNPAQFCRPFSPPILTELSSFPEIYDDLLGTEDFELSDVALEGVWFNSGL